ncbi:MULTISPECIES: hypothetical protein [Niastella]|nr:hypothetical protein [Niastella soli]
MAIVLWFVTMQVKSQQLTDSPAISNNTIVGVWQANTDVVASALKVNFQFFKDGRFIYNTDSYNALNPLISIIGVYKIEKNILYLKIQSTKQLTGFKIAASEPAFQFGSFQIDGGKITTIKQNDTDYDEHEIKAMADKKAPKKKVIKIDSETYYKVSDNPDKFSK